ncbi:MAG: hypothetical protein GQE15_27765 [Archangiaceae bacterium]|nr:hypothetical protein [Archangiaceae bacterium]
MRKAWLLVMLSLSCRYLAPAQPSWSPARPYEPPAGAAANPVSTTANRCGLECNPGFHCDQKTAVCVADAAPAASTPADAGPAWLP